MMCSRYLVGADGLTAHERRRGRRCEQPLAMFGEKVWFKELRSGTDRKDKFLSEWREGIWLGHSRCSNEHVLGTKEGAVRAYAVKRQPHEERWNADWLQGITGTPQQPDPNKAGIAIPVRVRHDPPVREPPVPSVENLPEARRMRINDAILAKYGYTQGCEGCRFKQAGMKETRGHSEVCRGGIWEAMDLDEEGRRHKEAQEERVTRRRTGNLESGVD